MKRFLILIALAIGFVSAKAQVRIDFMAGLASPNGENFEYVKKIGLGYSFDVLYCPGILDDQLSFGVAKDGNLLLSARASWQEKAVDLKASKLGLYGAKARFDLKTSSSAKPYGALTVGCGRLKCAYLGAGYDGVDEQGVDAEAAAGYEYSSAFAVKPEIGVCLGGFQFGIGWILPSKYGDRKIQAGCIQYNIGFRINAGN